MGANDREQNKREENKRKAAKQARGRRASSGGAVEWAHFDWIAAIALTEQLVERGGAIRIGKTRDGGAWALGVYMGDDYATEYIRPAEDFAESMVEICEAWVDAKAAEVMWERIIALRAKPPQ